MGRVERTQQTGRQKVEAVVSTEGRIGDCLEAPNVRRHV